MGFFGFGIDEDPFIKVSIYFGGSKDLKEYAKKAFDWFNRLRLDPKVDYKFPKGVKPKKVTDYFPGELITKLPGSNHEGLLGVPVVRKDGLIGLEPLPIPKEGFARTKKFRLKIGKSHHRYLFKKNKIFSEKTLKEDMMISFIPEGSCYTPKELARDILFLIGFNNEITKWFKLKNFYLLQIYKEKRVIMVTERIGVIEFEYPLEKRLKLYKKKKELDSFIFREDLKKGLDMKEVYEKKELKEEVKELFNKIVLKKN